jgi:DNA-binding CsgD family transcriptional regulator
MKHHLRGLAVVGEDGRIRCAGTLALHWLKKYFPETHSFDALPTSLRNWLFAKRGSSIAFTIKRNGDRLLVTCVEGHPKAPYCLLLEEYMAPNYSSTNDQDCLTKREAEILSWAAQCKTTWEIAKILDISSGTVRKHLQNIYRKLGVENRTAAVLSALQAFQPLIEELITNLIQDQDSPTTRQRRVQDSLERREAKEIARFHRH